jgi:hypothetical protein
MYKKKRERRDFKPQTHTDTHRQEIKRERKAKKFYHRGAEGTEKRIKKREERF